MKPTTKGWELLVSWKDGSSSWVKLKDLKNSNPVEVAEYAVANRIQEEPAFAWWVKSVLGRGKVLGFLGEKAEALLSMEF